MLLDQFSGVHGFDPRSVLEQLAIPAVWVYGGRDTSNPTDRDIQILEEIRAQHGSDFTICLFPNADHGLNDVVNGGPAPASQECVDPWLTERFHPRPRLFRSEQTESLRLRLVPPMGGPTRERAAVELRTRRVPHQNRGTLGSLDTSGELLD